MQQQVDFEVSERGARGKNEARRLRSSGRTPGIVYGLGKEPRAVAVDTKRMTRLLQSSAGRNSILNLQGGDGNESAMAVDYQIDPVNHALLHVDLRRVDLEKAVMAAVPVVPVGVAFGVKNQGGFEEMISREVTVECLPLDIPEKIEVDIAALHVGQAIRAGDIPASDKYRLAEDEDRLILHIMAAKTSAAAASDEEGGGQEEAAEGDGAAKAKKDD